MMSSAARSRIPVSHWRVLIREGGSLGETRQDDGNRRRKDF